MRKSSLLLLLISLLLIVLNFNSSLKGQDTNDFVQRALNDSTFTWFVTASNGIKIYYQKDSFAERHRMMLLRSVATAVDEVLEFLEESEYDTLLNVFYVESRDEMKRIVGRPVTGFSNWTANAIFIVLNPEWRSFEKHEFTHVVTMGRWGSPHVTSRWMIEGISIYSDGWCREYTVDEVAFHLLTNNQIPPLQEFLNDYSSLGEIRAGFYAASLIGFIYNTYGVQTLRNLWLNGFEDFSELLDGDVNHIYNSWSNHLKRNVRSDTEVDLDTINKLGCG